MTKWDWNAFTEWTESKDVILLRHSNNVAVLLPKRIADERQLAQVSAAIAERLGPPTRQT